jgi:hypothetical protein
MARLKVAAVRPGETLSRCYMRRARPPLLAAIWTDVILAATSSRYLAHCSRSEANPDGTRWKLSKDEAIAGTREGKWRCWTGGKKESV